MSALIERMTRAARLDVQLYEEVENDPSTMGQAMTVVLISSVAAGLGAAGKGGLGGMLIGIVAALVGWYLWAFLTYLIGTTVLKTPGTDADVGQLLRTIGFSAAPGVLRVFAFVPLLGGLIAILASVWMLVAMVVAVRQALDYESTGRAIGVCLIGWLVQLLVLMIAAALFGGIGALTGAAGG